MSDRRQFLKTGLIGAAAVAAASQLELTASAQTSAKPFELEEITITELRAGLDSRTLHVQQLVRMYSQRIADIDKQGPAINAVIEMNPDAMALAQKADQERKSGGARGRCMAFRCSLRTTSRPVTRCRRLPGRWR